MQSMHRVITHETRFVRGTRMRQLQRAHCRRSYVLLRASLVTALYVTSPYIVKGRAVAHL